MSERRICRVLGQHRSTQRKVPRGADDEQALTEDVIVKLLDGGMSINAAAKTIKVGIGTVHRIKTAMAAAA